MIRTWEATSQVGEWAIATVQLPERVRATLDKSCWPLLVSQAVAMITRHGLGVDGARRRRQGSSKLQA